MKRLIFLLILLMAAPLQALTYNAADNSTFFNGYAWGGHPQKDRAWQWAQDVQAASEIGVQIGTGEVFYVDSGRTASGAGTSWGTAFITLDEAFASGKATANRGDFVLVAQGHNEALTTADGVDVDVAGVTIIGCGRGSLKPTFDYDAAAGEFVIGADNVTIYNLRFRPSAEDILIGVDVESGADFATIIGCEFGFAETATDEFDNSINVSTSTGTVIEGNLIEMGTNEGDSGIWFIDCDGLVIRNNRIRGDFTEACIYEAPTDSGGKSEEILIEGNLLWNGGHGSLGTVRTIGVDRDTSGISVSNKALCNVANMNLAFFGPAMYNYDNYYSEKPGGHVTAFSINLAASSTTEASIDMTPGQ